MKEKHGMFVWLNASLFFFFLNLHYKSLNQKKLSSSHVIVFLSDSSVYFVRNCKCNKVHIVTNNDNIKSKQYKIYLNRFTYHDVMFST